MKTHTHSVSIDGWDDAAPVRLSNHWPRWIDHCRMEIRAYDDGSRETRYISEPYELYGEHLDELSSFTDTWDISIRADKAKHYPGATLAIIFTRK